jgi:hypothetical protein
MLKSLNPPKSKSTIPPSSKTGPICILFGNDDPTIDSSRSLSLQHFCERAC